MSFNVGEKRWAIMDHRNKLGPGPAIGPTVFIRPILPALDRYVAIRRFIPRLERNQNFLARFQREARLVAKNFRTSPTSVPNL